MERLPLYCQDQRRGEVTLSLWGPNGARTEIRTSMDDPGDGLYRAFLLGERGELALECWPRRMDGSPYAGGCTTGTWRRWGSSCGGRPGGPSGLRRPGCAGGKPAARPSCSIAGFSSTAFGPPGGAGGGGRGASCCWPCPWRRGSPSPWKPFSAWGGYSA